MSSTRSIKIIFLAALFLCIAGFIIFVIWFQRFTLTEETRQISNYGNVIAGSLRTGEVAASKAHLTLAARVHGYQNIIVTDSIGREFLSLNEYHKTRLDRFFSGFGLMPIKEIEATINFEGEAVGTIRVMWISRTIYTYVFCLCGLMLILTCFWLFLTVWRLNATLETRVRGRTVELEQEIAKHKETEQHLAKSQETLKVAMELAKMAHWESDVIKQIFYFNDQFYKIYGTTAEREGGYIMPTSEYANRFFLPEEAYMVDAEMERALAAADNSFLSKVEHRIIRGDGQIRHIAVHIGVIKDENGRTIRTYGVNQDITDRVLAEKERAYLEERLRQSQKTEAIGTLAGGIAHDFNNLLGVIVGYAELMQLEGMEVPTIQTGIRQILTASHRAKQLVRQILAYSRRADQKNEVVSVKTILQETLTFLRASLPSTITIDSQVAQDVGVVIGDPTQLQQIIINLSTNAAHAMENQGGTLQVKADNVSFTEDQVLNIPDGSPGEFARLRVSDDGAGIEPQILDRIFDPYFTTKETGKGSGLGLSVVHGIVLSHGGFIQVHSQVGQGSSFEIFLPRADGISQEEEEESAELRRGTETIMIVDDERTLVDLVSQLLSQLGYEVIAFIDPIDALSAFHENPDRFDLVITDMTMPKLTGLDLTEKLLTLRPELLIILCTGYSEIVNEETAMKMGVKAFLLKPYNIAQLSEAIQKLLP